MKNCDIIPLWTRLLKITKRPLDISWHHVGLCGSSLFHDKFEEIGSNT